MAKDVAIILGYSNPQKAVRDPCKGAEMFKENGSFTLTKSPYGVSIIPERDLYRLIMRSKLPSAERFEEWVVGEVLEIGNARMALARLDDDEKGVSTIDTLGGMQRVSVVNEPGLYSLIMTSRKPSAKQFKRWVTHEVLPALLSTVRSRLIWEGGK